MMGVEWVAIVLILLSGICSLLLISKVAPILLFDQYKDSRYIFNLLPGFMLILVFITDKLYRRYLNIYFWNKAIWLILILFVMLGYWTSGVEYLYKGADEQLKKLEAYSTDKAIFVTELPYFCSNLNVYFTKVDSVYPTNRAGLSSKQEVF